MFAPVALAEDVSDDTLLQQPLIFFSSDITRVYHYKPTKICFPSGMMNAYETFLDPRTGRSSTCYNKVIFWHRMRNTFVWSINLSTPIPWYVLYANGRKRVKQLERDGAGEGGEERKSEWESEWESEREKKETMQLHLTGSPVNRLKSNAVMRE